MKSGLPEVVVRSTKSTIASRDGPSFQEGSGSALAEVSDEVAGVPESAGEQAPMARAESSTIDFFILHPH
jgi:hypothetical protein